MRKVLLIVIALIAFAAGLLTVPARSEEQKAPGLTRAVRGDLLMGSQGDKAAMERATKAIEAAYKADAKDGEALAWHGALLWIQTGQAYQSGDMAKAQDLFGQALSEFDQAVALAPASVEVRSTRGQMMLMALASVPDEIRPEIAERAMADYLALEKVAGEKISMHAKGELLLGLATLYDGAGQKQKSQALVGRVAAEMADTAYGGVAKQWLGGQAPERKVCLGCHTEAGR